VYDKVKCESQKRWLGRHKGFPASSWDLYVISISLQSKHFPWGLLGDMDSQKEMYHMGNEHEKLTRQQLSFGSQ
jgi:hypothetical protein